MRGRSRSANPDDRRSKRFSGQPFSDDEASTRRSGRSSLKSSVGEASLYSGSSASEDERSSFKSSSSFLSFNTAAFKLNALQAEIDQIEETFEKQGVSLQGCQQLDDIILNADYLKLMKKNAEAREKFASLYERSIDFFAESRIAYSRQLFKAIPEDEFNPIFREEKDTSFYNQLKKDFICSSLLIQFDILQRNTLRKVLLAIERWSLILKKCIDAKDFHGGQMIIGALNCFSVKRLTETAKEQADLLSSDINAILLKAAELEESNYKLLREAMLDKSSIPYLGLYQQDYEFSKQASKEKSDAFLEEIIKQIKEKQAAIQLISVVPKNFWQDAADYVESSSKVNLDWNQENQFDDMLDQLSYQLISRGEKPRFKERPQKSYEFLQQIKSESWEFIAEKISIFIKNNSAENTDMSNAATIEKMIKDINQMKKDRSPLNESLLQLVGELEKYKSNFSLQNKPGLFRKKHPAAMELSEIIDDINQLRSKMSNLRLVN